MTLPGPGDFSPPDESLPVYQCQDCEQRWQDDEVKVVSGLRFVGGRHVKTKDGHCPDCDTGNLVRVK